MTKHPGIKLVQFERERQIKKGYDAAHDDAILPFSFNGQKALINFPCASIAISYIINIKPEDRISCLTIAAALIVAEIEKELRIQYKCPKAEQKP